MIDSIPRTETPISALADVALRALDLEAGRVVFVKGESAPEAKTSPRGPIVRVGVLWALRRLGGAQ